MILLAQRSSDDALQTKRSRHAEQIRWIESYRTLLAVQRKGDPIAVRISIRKNRRVLGESLQRVLSILWNRLRHPAYSRKRRENRTEVVIHKRRKIRMLVSRQSRDESLRMQQRVARLLISDRPVDKRTACARNQISVCVGVVHLNPKIHRSERVVRQPSRLGLFPLQTALALSRGNRVERVHKVLDRRLKMRWIIDLEHQLPRRSRQHRAVNRERKFAAHRRRKIVADVDSGLRLKLRKMLLKARINRVHRSKQIIYKRRRVLYYKRRDDVCIRRYELQRTHRSGRRKPRSDAVIRWIEAEHRAV